MSTHGLLKLALISTLAFLFSCKKEDGPKLRANKTEIKMPATEGLDSIIVSSNVSWKIAKPANATWIRMSVDSGDAGATTVYIHVLENPVNEPRVSELSIQSVEEVVIPVTVKIIQQFDLQLLSFLNRSAPGNELIEIYGRGFSDIPGENSVTINGVDAAVETATNSVLKVRVPAKCGLGPIIVGVGLLADTSNVDFIYEWTGEVEIVAGSGDGYLDGPAASAKFSHPQGLSFDKDNNIYVADYNNSKVRMISRSGQVSTIAGRIPPVISGGTGPYSDYGLPSGIEVNGKNEILIVEFNSSMITKYVPPGSVSIVAGGYSSSGIQNGNGVAATFYRPIDIAVDSYGNMFVADMENLCVRKITPNADVTTFAGGQWGDEDGIGTAARFNRPAGIAIDSHDNLYVTDYYNNKIKKITAGGVVTTLAGTGTHGSMDGNALTEARFTQPMAIAVTADGTVYVSHSNGDNTIRMIRPNGIVESIASFKEKRSGLPFSFSFIAGLAIDKNGILHATDYTNGLICKITYK